MVFVEIGRQVVLNCIIRGGDSVNESSVGAPFSALVTVNLNVYEEADCHLCKNNVPINTTVDHGKKYLKTKGITQ